VTDRAREVSLMRPKLIGFISRLATIAGTLYGWTAVGRCGPPVTADDVLKVWEAREAKVKTARFAWDKREVVPKDSGRDLAGDRIKDDTRPNPPNDLPLDGKCRLTIAAGRFRYEYDGREWIPEQYEVRPKVSVSTFDDRTYKRVRLAGDVAGYPSAGINPTAERSEFNDLSIHPLWRAVRGAQAVAKKFPLLLYEPTGRRVVVNGRPCLEFARESHRTDTKHRLYLDPERDFQVVREITTAKEVVTLKLDVVYAANPELGWLPSAWEYVARGRSGQPLVSVACKLTSAEINPTVRDSEFDVQLPPGTRVSDVTSGKEVQYVIREDGDKGREVVRDGRGITYQQLVEAGPEPFSWRNVLVGVSLVGLVGSCVVLAWRRWARRPSSGSAGTAGQNGHHNGG
jgi:hypothetical protein